VRFFSHDWAASEDEEECRRVAHQYADMLRTYPLPARSSVTRFVESVDLRGAILDGLAADRHSRTVALDIFCGDRQSGYKLLKIVYEDARVTTDDQAAFERVLAAKSPQIRYDEFDLARGLSERACCRHRYLFWPKEYGEGAVEFFNFSWALQPARERPRSAEASPR
jgi:hypothetical protein